MPGTLPICNVFINEEKSSQVELNSNTIPLELDIPKIMFWYFQELFLKDFYPFNYTSSDKCMCKCGASCPNGKLLDQNKTVLAGSTLTTPALIAFLPVNSSLLLVFPLCTLCKLGRRWRCLH